MTPDLTKESIRIGTLAGRKDQTASYIRQILPHGFESFQSIFSKRSSAVDLPTLAAELKPILAPSGAVISSLGIYGNPLENRPEDLVTIKAWETCIDHAHLFGTDLVCGFAGASRASPCRRASRASRRCSASSPGGRRTKGVRIAFENCEMGGTWESGDWNIAHAPDAWELMFDAVPAANLGLEWEPCHQLARA